MRIIDVLTTVANNGTISFARLYRTKTERMPVPIEKVLQNLSTYRFIFQNPLDLHKLLEDPDPVSVAICQGIKRLRLDLLQYFAEGKVTLKEALDDNSKRVDLQALMENWRVACRLIPRDHGLQELTFDLSGANELCRLRLTSRTIQLISTTLVLKARQNLRCRIQGAANLDHAQMRHVQMSLVSR